MTDRVCCHRGQGCISQNGYLCLNTKCEPIDEKGRRFMVISWMEDGQPFTAKHYLTQGEGVPV